MALEEADQARVDELAKRASSAFAESDLGQVRQLYGQVLKNDSTHPAANYRLGYLEYTKAAGKRGKLPANSDRVGTGLCRVARAGQSG